MPRRDYYAPGTPSWVDLGSPDVAASVRFYGDLFRWKAVVADAAAGYTMCFLRDRPVAGVGPQTRPGPPAWTTYVTVESADDTLEAARRAGARILREPTDVVDAGRTGMFADPQGAVIAVWQPKAHQGAALVNEPGTLAWNELVTSHPAQARDFYGSVFGWDSETHDMGPMTYTEWKLGAESVGGMAELGPPFPPGLPPSWMTYFAVDDCDKAVA
ncbi:MAG TPA: VOC family protein, partial [Acidimicrobiales bacterium]|nr:VOC family protein [Acidimicrobiales bacterium]